MNKENLKQLSQFTGSEQFFGFPPFLILSEGVRFLIENADCYWLLNIIGSYQPDCRKDRMLRDMQFWTIRKNKQPEKYPPFTLGAVLNSKQKRVPYATVVCERDTGNVAFTQDVNSTDFPFDVLGDEFKIWVGYGGEKRMTAYLPSEH